MTTRRLSRPPSDPPPVRLRDPDGVVAAVPYLLGFVPRRSLVVIGIDAEQGVGPTVRWDWEPGLARDLLAATWTHVSGVLGRNGCTAGLVVLYTDADPDDLPAGWAGPVLDVVRRPAPGPVLDVVDVLVVGPGRFRSLLCDDPACCPSDGAPRSATTAHPVAATFVLSGRSPAPDRDSLEPRPDPAPARDLAAADRAARRARTHPCDPEDLLLRWTACLPAGPGPALAGELAATWLVDRRLRDACLAVLLPGGARVAAALLRRGDRAGSAQRTGPRPAPSAPGAALAASLSDPGCARATRAGAPVLRRMAALTTGRERAVVTAAHAWLCWAAGEGTAAGVLAARALADDPGQSMALLVDRCLAMGIGAPWTATSWEDGPRDAGGSGIRTPGGPAPR